MTAHAPRVSVVVPTIGRRERLVRVLDRLERQRAPAKSFEVLVVEDAAETEARFDPGPRSVEVRVLRATRPGASAARNLGVHEAGGEIVLFLDDDVLAESSLVAEHLATHERHPEPEVGVLGRVRWADELRITPFMRWVERGIQFDYESIVGEEAGWGRFYTANASVKRKLVERVGGFDEERLPFGYEDLDLALRMHAHGFRLLYNERASAEHLHPMDLSFWRVRVRRIAAAERRFCELHPEVPPHFHRLFADALAAPPASGRGRHLIRFVGRAFPVLGKRVWYSADMAYRQALAPAFMAAWQAAGQASEAGPDLAERQAAVSVEGSAGSPEPGRSGPAPGP